MINDLKRLYLNAEDYLLDLFVNAVEMPIPPAEKSAEPVMIKIVPIGSFPEHHNGGHEITADTIQEMATNFAKSGTDLLFDWEHNSVWGDTKAAGWANTVEAREDGLYANMPNWTPKAAESIENREYRYLSPTYRLNSRGKDGNYVGASIHSVALTNTPYMDTEIDHIGNRRPIINQNTDNMPTQEQLDAMTAERDTAKAELATVQAQVTELNEKLNSHAKAQAELLVNSHKDKLDEKSTGAWIERATADYAGTEALLNSIQAKKGEKPDANLTAPKSNGSPAGDGLANYNGKTVDPLRLNMHMNAKKMVADGSAKTYLEAVRILEQQN